MEKSVIIPNPQILLIGEIHGIRENVDILKLFVGIYLKTNRRFAIGLEWPSFLSEEINQYISGRANRLSWRTWAFVKDKDGRISKEHLAFLSWLKKKNSSLPPQKRILVVCFDENPKRWNERDKRMAQNLEKIKIPIVAITGNLHAQKTKFKFGKKLYTPIGFRLSGKKSIFVKINYLSGKFYNHGIKRIQSVKKMKLGLIKNKSKDFDYIYAIENARPVELLKI